jgi:hypothetical protein
MEDPIITNPDPVSTTTLPRDSDQPDAMPKEVASELLADPKAQLTNRMVKNCLKAREYVIPSAHPIVKTPEGQDGYEYDLRNAWKTPEEKITNKRRLASFQTLAKWNRRAAKSSMIFFGKAAKAKDETVREKHYSIAKSLVQFSKECRDELKRREGWANGT